MKLLEMILSEMINVSKPQKKFITTLMKTMVAAYGKVNFRSLSRYSGTAEKTFRRWFRKAFDFSEFNSLAIDKAVVRGSDLVAAFDQSFDGKSGKNTWGKDYFWNGCASKDAKQYVGLGDCQSRNKESLHCCINVLYGKIRVFPAKVFHELAQQRGCKIEKGNMVNDHVHMMISIPPKYAVSEVIGYIKGKSAIAVARQFGGKERNFNGERFWARGYAVSTVGFEVEQIRAYIKNQEHFDNSDCYEGGDF